MSCKYTLSFSFFFVLLNLPSHNHIFISPSPRLFFCLSFFVCLFQFFQLRIYALLVHKVMNELPSKLRLLFLGSCDDIKLDCNIESIEKVETEILDIYKEMQLSEKQGDFQPNTSPLCNYCHFKDSCPAFNK